MHYTVCSAMWEYPESALCFGLLHCTYQNILDSPSFVHSLGCLSSTTCTPLSFCRFCLLLSSYLAVGRCLKMWKTRPTVTPQKVASRTLSSTRETILRSQASELLIPTLWSKQAIAPPQAYLRLRTNQSCNAAWNIFSSFYPD